MVDVFILGAGFSKAVSSHMPLLAELSAALETQTGAVAPAGQAQRLHADVEYRLTFLAQDHPWLSQAENLRNRAAFLETSKLLSTQLLTAQNSALESTPPAWAQQLVRKWHDDQIGVITLNYDTLVEKLAFRACWSSGGSGSLITPETLWPLPIPDIKHRLPGGMFGARSESPTFRLMRLHGCLAWCYSGQEDFFGETIWHIGLTTGWYPDSEDVYQQRAPDEVPLVVPPTLEKTSFFTNETVRGQWELAGRTVAAADRIYCLGYSLPTSDLMMRFFLEANTVGKTVLPVDVRTDVAAHYKRMLPNATIDDSYISRNEPIARFVDSYAIDTVVPDLVTAPGPSQSR